MYYRCQRCYETCSAEQARKEMGHCPYCHRNSLEEIAVRCPFCGEDMGEPTQDTIDRIAWGCTACKVKLYKEI